MPPLTLTYPSIEPILRFFCFDKRTKLIKRISSLRAVNKRVPILFDNVQLIDDSKMMTVRLEKFVWKLTRIGDIAGTIEFPRMKIRVVEDIHRSLDRLFRYYLKYSTIKKLTVQHLQLHPGVYQFSRIGSLKVIWTNRTEVERDIKAFQNTPIRVMEVHASKHSNEWTKQITTIQCKHLKVKTVNETPNDMFLELSFKKLEIDEKLTTFEKFQRMCLKFKDEDLKMGSQYSAKFQGDRYAFWNNLKQTLPLEVVGNDFFVLKTLNPATELKVTRWKKDYLSKYKFKMEIVKSGTGQQIKEKEDEPTARKRYILQSMFSDDNLMFTVIPIWIAFCSFLIVLIFMGYSQDVLLAAFLTEGLITVLILLVVIYAYSEEHSCYNPNDGVQYCKFIELTIAYTIVIATCLILISYPVFPFYVVYESYYAPKEQPVEPVFIESVFIQNLGVLLKNYTTPEEIGFRQQFMRHAGPWAEPRLTEKGWAEVGRMLYLNLDGVSKMKDSENFWK